MTERRKQTGTPAGMRKTGPSFGEGFRRERELRRISLREVAEATKINLRYLEALEQNDFEHLPGGVFNRGFVRAYAQHIGIDPDAMVNAYLLEEQASNGEPVLGDENRQKTYRSIVQSRGAGGERQGTPWLKWLVACVAVVLVLAAGALLYYKFAAAAPETPEDHGSTRVADPESNSLPAAGAALDARSREHGPTASATVFIDRAVAGRLNCDNRQFEVLDGMRPGARLTLACDSYLIVDASDAGALRISLPGRPTVPLGPDGQSLAGHRIDMPATSGEDGP